MTKPRDLVKLRRWCIREGASVNEICASATLEVIETEGLFENARKVGESMKRRFQEMAKTHEMIGDVRGKEYQTLRLLSTLDGDSSQTGISVSHSHRESAQPSQRRRPRPTFLDLQVARASPAE